MKINLIIVIIFFYPLFTISQTSGIARFDDEELSAREFKMRFELTPRITSSTDVDSQKTHFLYTLLAEKLWAKEARNLGLDTSLIYQQYISNLEKMLVRDELFKQDILSKLKISENEINDGVLKKRQELFFKFLYSQSKSEIDSLYNKLSYTTFDSVLIGRKENLEQSEPISVVYGQLDSQIEEIVYKLQPGEYTSPIQQEFGWVVYYLVGKRYLDESITGNEESIRSSVEDVIKKRKLQKLMNEYLAILLKDVNVNADGTIFRLLANKLTEFFTEKYLEESNKYILTADELLKLMQSFPNNILTSDFIKFKDKPVSLKEFILYLYSMNFITGDKDLQSVSSSLNKVVKDYIRFEILAREGYSRNLQLLPEVKNEIKMWQDNFLSQYLRNQFNKEAQVTELELESIVEDNSDTLSTELVSITEVKLENLDQVQVVLSKLQYNYDFEEVIKNMNLDPASILFNEELKPVGSFGDLSQFIAQMETGEVYGPIRRASGFSIIKLNKRINKQLTNLERNRLQLDYKKNELFFKKLSQILSDETVKLADKYELVVDESLLDNINVTEIPTMIYRYYGFGGQTSASPFLYLFYEWMKEYKKQTKEAL